MDSHTMYQRHLKLGMVHVAEGRARIRRQIALIRRMRARGLDTGLAIKVLYCLRDCSASDREHLTLLRRLVKRRSVCAEAKQGRPLQGRAWAAHKSDPHRHLLRTEIGNILLFGGAAVRL